MGIVILLSLVLAYSFADLNFSTDAFRFCE